MHFRLILLALSSLLAACVPTGAPTPSPPPPTSAAVVDMIPRTLSGEDNQDSEPFLAIHPTNSQLMAASAFTPNPGSAAASAPIFVTQDGGNSWSLRDTIPSDEETADMSHAFPVGGAGSLHVGILKKPGQLLLNELLTSDFLSGNPMTVSGSRANIDQPFVQAITINGSRRVYVGLNDFGVTDGHTASVDISTDGGATFRPLRIETRTTAGQDGPSIRVAAASNGVVYAAFLGWRQFDGVNYTSDVVVVRDDDGAVGAPAFQALKDSDGLAGRIVATGRTIPWSTAPTMGQERIGSTLSIAVDPNNSAIVYLAWGDRAGSGDTYTIHLRRSTDSGATWSNDLQTLVNATCISLAIASSGTAGLLYHQLYGGRWIVHLTQSRDGFATARDTILATTPADTPSVTFLPYLGDYNFLLASGGEFRGVFSANNTPDRANFPQGISFQRTVDFNAQKLLDSSGHNVPVSIDPFYFRIPVI